MAETQGRLLDLYLIAALSFYPVKFFDFFLKKIKKVKKDGLEDF
jgi:hypothetical protein